MPFQLVSPGGEVVADGFSVFGQYIVSWRGEPPEYRTWAAIEDAIIAHGQGGADLTVRWT